MPAPIDTTIAKKFAREVVDRLREHGYEAYWAGGCVRDQLMDHEPKDYDVATDAHPEQVQEVFGRNRAHAVGAAFGVINIRGPKGAGHIEIATFREDQEYLDGRRPSGVIFSSAEEDAKRRDFTINGLFYDPIEQQVLDFVGGEADLEAEVIRAIGNPFERIAEDRLRMLRAVRFAAKFEFAIEPETVAAIRERADEIELVSRERITHELEVMFTHSNRVKALDLLAEVGLIPHLSAPPLQHQVESDDFALTRSIIANLSDPSFADVVAGYLWPFAPNKNELEELCRTWRISNDDRKYLAWLLANAETLLTANAEPWPKVQRRLIQTHCRQALGFLAAFCKASSHDPDGIQFCQERLTWPAERLNPTPLLNGTDLQQLGMKPGPNIKAVLDLVRDAQLDQLIDTRQEAEAMVKKQTDEGA